MQAATLKSVDDLDFWNFLLVPRNLLSVNYDISLMGLTKTEGFTKNQLDLAALSKALAHPARIAILQFLATQKACVCGDIVNELPLSQSTVSQHLRELKSVGLIKGEVEGPSVCYCIDEKVWHRAKAMLTDLFRNYDPKNCC